MPTLKRVSMQSNEKMGKITAWLRRALLIALLLAAGAMVYLRQAGGATPLPTATPAPTVAPQDGRTARELAYDKDVTALQALVRDESVAQEVRDQAAKRLSDLTDEHQNELAVETALREAGYGECVAIQRNGALTILTPMDMDESHSAAILALCAAHTEIPIENVRMMSGTVK